MRSTEPSAALNRLAGHRKGAHKDPQSEQARFEFLDRTLSGTLKSAVLSSLPLS